MNVRRKVARQNDTLGKTKTSKDELKSKGIEEDVAVVETFTLKGKQIWTGEKMLSLVGSYEDFKKNVLILAEKDSEYKHWLQTAGQSELAGEWGIDQSTISRLIGPIQREHKNDLKAQAKALRADGLTVKEIIEELQIDVDESTVRRWIREVPFDMDQESSAIPETKEEAEYGLKIYKLEDELKKEKRKSQNYKKEIQSLKAELVAFRAKYAGA